MSNSRMMKESMEERMGRYLSGEAGGEEKAVFERDLALDPVLRDHFSAFQRMWQAASSDSHSEWNTDKAWQQFKQYNQIDPVQTNSPIRRLSWAVAAALFLAVGAAVFLWYQAKPDSYAYEDQKDDHILLADGTKIYLNAGSTIDVFPLTKKQRRVHLQGEAFFEVASDPTRPFIAESGETVTEVVGTSFNLHQSGSKTEIFVREGKVIFRSKLDSGSALALTSGEAAVFQDAQIVRLVNPSPNMQSWHSKQLDLSGIPIEVMISDMSRYFNREIMIENESVKDCKLGGKLLFNEPKIENVLAIIAATINANVEMDGDKCIIRGGKCP